MKKMMKSILALCLAAMLLASLLPMGAMALTNTSTGNIVISGLTGTDADTTDGVAVSAYKVLDVQYDNTADQPVQPVYTWNSAVAAWVSTNYPAYIDTANANAVTEAFYSLTSDTTGYGTDLATFYDKMTAAVKSSTVSATGKGNCTLSGLPMGGYLVLIENGMKIYRPSSVNLIPTWNAADQAWKLENAQVVIKASDPGITKTQAVNGTANADEVKVGDTITYTVTAGVPVYPAHAAAKGYSIGDDLPAGVTLDASSVTVMGIKSGAANTTLEAGADKDYTLTTTATTTPASTAVDFLIRFDYEQIRGFDSVEVTYSVTVNQNLALGTSGNANKAILTYNNNPYNASTWKEKDASVSFYSFGIKVIKTDDKGAALAGAEFTLSTNDAELTFLKDETNNRYYLSSAADSSATLVVDANGILNVHGLVPGTYVLTESKAPGGYVKLQSPVTITITESAETKGAVAVTTTDDSGSTTVTAKNDGIIEMTIPNVKGFTLPVTGGEGIMMFSIVGIVMMGCGVLVILAVLRKWKRSN